MPTDQEAPDGTEALAAFVRDEKKIAEFRQFNQLPAIRTYVTERYEALLAAREQQLAVLADKAEDAKETMQALVDCGNDWASRAEAAESKLRAVAALRDTARNFQPFGDTGYSSGYVDAMHVVADQLDKALGATP